MTLNVLICLLNVWVVHEPSDALDDACQRSKPKPEHMTWMLVRLGRDTYLSLGLGQVLSADYKFGYRL